MNAVVLDAPRDVVATPAQEITPAQMLAIAVQQGADLQKLEKLMDLQERWEANRARKAFDAAISAAKAEIKPVAKKRKVDYTNKNGGGRTNYEYEDFAAIASEVDPILAKHGLSYRHRSKQDGKQLTITCVLSHRDGHFEETSLTAANDESGNKNGIQAIGSAATYLQRYTLKLALGIAAAKDDDARSVGKNAAETISKEQIEKLDALLTEVGANKSSFLKWARINSLEEILAKNYDACVKAIEAKRK
jgi:hypothetical protein